VQTLFVTPNEIDEDEDVTLGEVVFDAAKKTSYRSRVRVD
jgi:hypothetical protein